MILASHGIIGSQITQFVGLLDTYSGAAAAYSLRKLRSAYTGSAIRVRRASDNTEQDIGFIAEDLDTSALTSFCSGTNGFVKTWYDQSGNANDAEQTTLIEQPQIVSSGSVITENGKPSLEFNASAGLSANALSSIINGTDFSLSAFSVYKPDLINRTEELYTFGSSASGNGKYYLSRNNTSSQYRVAGNDGSTVISLLGGTVTTNQILRSDIKKSITLDVFINNSVIINNQSFDFGTFSGFDEFGIGYWEQGTGTTDFDGKYQELILYSSDQSSNRTGIETNLNNFYSIY